MTGKLPTPAPVATDWRSRAACRGSTDPDLFFPVEENGRLDERQVAEAKAVCAGCAARDACLDEALARIPEGIAGGMTPQERRFVGQSRSTFSPVPGAELARIARTRAEVAAAGAVLLASGRSAQAVATTCGVSERTVARWRARSSATGTAGPEGAWPSVVASHEVSSRDRSIEHAGEGSVTVPALRA